MESDLISLAFKKAVKLLDKAHDDMGLLPPEVSTFLFVHSAQGVIDNGGYLYFFESNWPNNPSYSKFVESYRAIGCEKQANELARVISTFSFDNAHLEEDLRNKYMDDNYDENKCEIKGWGNDLCGDEKVWAKLEQYYISNKKKFAW
jgi:hypothetical protein